MRESAAYHRQVENRNPVFGRGQRERGLSRDANSCSVGVCPDAYQLAVIRARSALTLTRTLEGAMAKEQRSTKEKRKPKKAAGDKAKPAGKK